MMRITIKIRIGEKVGVEVEVEVKIEKVLLFPTLSLALIIFTYSVFTSRYVAEIFPDLNFRV